MAEKGFAIRCPHCQKWNVWEKARPNEIAANEAEFDHILSGLKKASNDGKPWEYSPNKIIRCQRPRWSCPTSFETVVFRSRDEAKKCLAKVPDAWPLKRDFRLYKADCKSRWVDKYYAIMFCTPPFARTKSIRLEELMDRELLSRLIVGISVEINLPVTIYAANVFEKPKRGRETYWMPIDAYPMGEQLVPPRFNIFCRTCRELVIKQLKKEFDERKVGVNNCPAELGKDGKCAGRKAACVPKKHRQPKDWNHCPAFIEERKRRDPCYKCDVDLIKEVRKRWREEDPMENGVTHRCWAGFTDIAFPIIVHHHLLGVAGTGQVFFDPKQIYNVANIVGGWDILEKRVDDLIKAKQDLIGEEDKLKKDKKQEWVFFATDDKLSRVIELLRSNVERIRTMANARYRDIRRRSENMFREEILSYIQSRRKEEKFFGLPVLHILKRMREFWAFKAVYLAEYSYKTEKITLIGVSSKRKSNGERPFGLPGKTIGRESVTYHQTHPVDFMYRPKQEPHDLDPLMKNLLKVFKRAMVDSELCIPRGRSYFFVVVPFWVWDEVYFFVFTVRDDPEVSELESRLLEDVSELCQEIMLSVCTEVVYEFYELRHGEAMERAWIDFSAQAGHRIGNEINSVGTLLDILMGEIVGDPDWVRKWEERLKIMQGCISRTKTMLTEQARLTARIKPELRRTDIKALIKRATEGLLLPTATLNIESCGAQNITEVDPDLMEQVFRELCANAVRAGGGEVSIDVEITEDEKQLYISFRDDGPGIPLEDAERVFEPFVSSRQSGSGLGLTTVRLILKAHDGTIEIGPSDVGANFIITLPLTGDLR